MGLRRMKPAWIFGLVFAIILWYLLPPRINRVLPFVLIAGGLLYTEVYGGGVGNVFNFLKGEWDKLK